jgi:guanosine-3',5'-bis(diphosphate) 3'-pyrophosphohydrolase
MVPLRELIDRVSSYHPGADAQLISKAYAYSSQMHEGQLRKSGDPYFIHPSQVAHIIAEMKLDGASVCAALLHDVIEDTGATEQELTNLFGAEVSFLVDGVTKLGRINFSSKEDQQAESFRKMLVAMARDIRVLLVKLADRLDNMRTLEHMKVDSQERIAKETLDIYAPLAGRLGIHWLKNELETLSFKYLHPDAYTDLERKAKRVAVNRNA